LERYEQAGARAGSGRGCGPSASALARAPRHGSAGGWESLTATERAAPPVADGLTYGAVARRLSISPHIVNTHLRHVFAKLGVPNRVALAAVVHHSIK
jgi:DNA-binding CsgD family transcriptional regulator